MARYVECKDRLTGTTMWVAEDRIKEYKAAGLIALPADPVKPKVEEPKKVEESKKAVATKKKR